MGITVLPSRSCLVCGEFAYLTVDEEHYQAVFNWNTGKDRRHIQYALPFLSENEREILISGTHATCFDKLYDDDEDEDEEEIEYCPRCDDDGHNALTCPTRVSREYHGNL